MAEPEKNSRIDSQTPSTSDSTPAPIFSFFKPAGNSNFFRLENQRPCIGPVCAVQHCLYRCWYDETQTPSRRMDAMVLAFWDDLYDKPLCELGLKEKNEWSVSFMIYCLETYPPSPKEISKDPLSQINWEHALKELQQGQIQKEMYC